MSSPRTSPPKVSPLRMSSPSLRWSSPMLSSSSPPRTPMHIAAPAQAFICGDPLSSPLHRHSRAYSSTCDSFLEPHGVGDSTSQTVKAEDKQEAFWLSSFTSRALPGGFSLSDNATHTSSSHRERVGLGGGDKCISRKTASASGLSHTCMPGSATPVTHFGRFGDAIGCCAHSIPHEDSPASRGDGPYQPVLVSPTAPLSSSWFLADAVSQDGGRSVAPAAVVDPAVDRELELMLEELLAALEAETDVVNIAVLLSQLHRLGLRW